MAGLCAGRKGYCFGDPALAGRAAAGFVVAVRSGFYGYNYTIIVVEILVVGFRRSFLPAGRLLTFLGEAKK